MVAKQTKNRWPLIVATLLAIFIIGAILSKNQKPTKPTSAPTPTQQITAMPTPTVTPISQAKAQATCPALTVITPQPGQQVSSPLPVSVIVDNRNPKCHWTVFEAQAGSMEIKDKNGTVLGTGILTTTNPNWMTVNPVTYKGTITFTRPAGKKLSLTITEENPSGRPGAQQITIPLTY